MWRMRGGRVPEASADVAEPGEQGQFDFEMAGEQRKIFNRRKRR
jgi:hypothetical protein